MSQHFEVGLTQDFLSPQGQLTYRDIGLSVLEAAPSIRYRFFDEHLPIVTPAQLDGLDAVISLTPRYTRDSLRGVERLTLIARFGVGYDSVDVQACTEADVLLCITPGAVNRPVAEATLAWMLALNHKVLLKDRLVREGRWKEAGQNMGAELRDHTLGVVGLGGIGGTLVEMLRGLGMNPPLAFDPFASPESAEKLGVGLVPLETLMKESDFVSINCPLNEQTRKLIGRDELAMMKPSAFLINTARGGIVDEAALIEALSQKRIAGAAIDVFENEPVTGDHPLAQFDNVILAPHSIAWTDELFRDIGQMACGAAVTVAAGEIPPGAVNPEVCERPGFQAKLKRYRESHSQ